MNPLCVNVRGIQLSLQEGGWLAAACLNTKSTTTPSQLIHCLNFRNLGMKFGIK